MDSFGTNNSCASMRNKFPFVCSFWKRKHQCFQEKHMFASSKDKKYILHRKHVDLLLVEALICFREKHKKGKKKYSQDKHTVASARTASKKIVLPPKTHNFFSLRHRFASARSTDYRKEGKIKHVLPVLCSFFKNIRLSFSRCLFIFVFLSFFVTGFL